MPNRLERAGQRKLDGGENFCPQRHTICEIGEAIDELADVEGDGIVFFAEAAQLQSANIETNGMF